MPGKLSGIGGRIGRPHPISLKKVAVLLRRFSWLTVVLVNKHFD